jgi:hypothetical protein
MKRFIAILSLSIVIPGLSGFAHAQGTATPAWLSFVGDGSAGPYSCTSGTCNLGDERWVSSFTVSAGATLVVAANNGPLIIRSPGTCTVAGTISNSVNTGNGGGVLNEGDFGGAGGGGGGGTLAGKGGLLSVGPGGLPVVDSGPKGAANGGAGGNAQSTTTGQLHELLSGGAFWPIGGGTGGVGGSSGSGTGGQGGNGGGAVILVCNAINFTGTIDVSGAPGSSAPAANTGAGGGGGGGYVILSAVNFTAKTGTINVSGGAGGSCNSQPTCGAGGAGGNGWSYFQTIE